jgi:hypothetical protein
MPRVAFLIPAILMALSHATWADEGPNLPPVEDPTVRAECGACHMVFPPQFLPARSWQRLMTDLSSHFGEDASLGEAERQAITAYLVAHAADAPRTRGGQRFLRGLAVDAAPLRISETPFWRREHDEISAAELSSQAVRTPANCAACHKGAERGDFSEPE